MELTVGLISLAGYHPGSDFEPRMVPELVDFLRNKTIFPEAYIEEIERSGKQPGKIETNYDGWESQPWFEAWVKSLPPKQQENPFRGTKERRRVPMDPTSLRESVQPHPMLPSDAEVLAGAMAILRSGLVQDDIDLVLAHSQVPDHPLPQNVSLVQHKLGLKNAGAYAIDTCCSSFVSMIELATAMVKTGIKKNVLIVSSFLDSHVGDKTTYFSPDCGDAAVAGIVSATDAGYISSHSTSHGDRHDGIIYEQRLPALYKGVHSSPDARQLFTTFHNMDACKEIAKNAEKDMLEVVSKAVEKAGLSIDDMDFFVTHQPVAWAGPAWRNALGIPEEKYYQSFEKYGNIATAASATNLTEAIELGLIKAGDKVITSSSGAGENHIAVIHQIPEQLVKNVKRYAH